MTSAVRLASLLVTLGGFLAGAPLEAQQGSIVEDTVHFAPFGIVHVYRTGQRPSPAGGDTLAVMISGDGGWAEIDRSVAEGLARRGIAVVGIDALRYFWSRRTPDGTSRDLTRVIEHYSVEWHKDSVLVIGYSFGADVLPFMVARLPPAVRGRIGLVALISPQRYADFEFHVTDWLPFGGHRTSHPVIPEVRKLAGTRVMCVYGTDDHDAVCPSMDTTAVEVHVLPGGHHFDGDYERLAKVLLTGRP